MPTLGDQLIQIREMKERAVVLRTLSGYLRLRYIARDSTPAVAHMKAEDGSPVSEAVIETIAIDLEKEAGSLEKGVRAAMSTEVQNA
jgi:hypothetical protein